MQYLKVIDSWEHYVGEGFQIYSHFTEVEAKEEFETKLVITIEPI